MVHCLQTLQRQQRISDMRSILFVSLWVVLLVLSEHFVCLEQDQPVPLELDRQKIKQNSAFTFKIQLRPAQVRVYRNCSGSFFLANFSTLILNGAGYSYVYHSSSFSFKFPPQNRIAALAQDAIEMQILYQLNSQDPSNWKHRNLAMSITFVATEYVPGHEIAISRHFHQNIKNGSVIDFEGFLPLISGLNMLVYKGVHSSYSLDTSFLWLIRKQLHLISQKDLNEVKRLIMDEMQPKQDCKYHGFVKRLSDVNEVEQTKQDRDLPGKVEQL